jgi:ribonucleoside-diphosphate reductase beta chain
VDACNRLLEDHSDIEAKVDFVTTYHLVIEGTLALTGQNYITGYCEKHDVLPGFIEGFKLISQDEHRHVAYGTWFLQQKARDAALARRIQDCLVELLPLAAGVFVPPGMQLGDDYDILGYSSDEVNAYAFRALSRRLKVIGVGLPAVEAA